MIIDRFRKGLKFYRDFEKPLTLNEYANIWQEYLFERVIRLFEWNGLPFPQKEIEMRLLSLGYCGIVPLKDSFMVVKAEPVGVTQYFDEFTHIQWATPLKDLRYSMGNHLIDDKHILCSNDSCRNDILWLVEQYALELAHCDITMVNALVNARKDGIITANKSTTVESARLFYKDLYKGKVNPIKDSIYEGIKFNGTSTNSETFVKAFELRKNLLSQFFECFGIASTYEKKGNMIDSEVTRNDNLLMININDMLKARQEICEKIKEGYNVDVSVKCLVEITERSDDNDN